MISTAQAEALIMQHTPLPVAVRMPLALAVGHGLAEAVPAERDHPPFDRITHDGIALDARAAGDARLFAIESYAAAGAPRQTLRDVANCIEVATGAPLPQGCDTVIPYELLTVENGVASCNTPVTPGGCLHRQGSDIRQGDMVLPAGAIIGSIETAILAANGVAMAPVWKKPAIGILATGDELVAVDAPVAAYQIRRSNDLALKAALTAHGFTDSEADWVPDDKDRMQERLHGWLQDKDVIIITGGVSRGSFDYVPGVLEALGVGMVFHHVAQRPGKPLWFGVSAHGKMVFALPGNPASCLTCLIRYVIPALQRMSGGEPPLRRVRLGASFAALPALTWFAPVRYGDDGETVAPVAVNTSGDFTGLQGSVGIVEIPAGDTPYDAGSLVLFYPWGAP